MSNLSTVGAVVFLLVSGCGGVPKQTIIRVDEAQRALAVDATSGLREMFNSDGCGSIYSEASSYFRSQSREGWMNECERLRGKLGNWESFEVKGVVPCATSNLDVFACVYGSATFASAAYQVEVGWLLEEGRARLDSLFLDNGEKWAFPPTYRYRPRYDPPSRDPGGPSSS